MEAAQLLNGLVGIVIAGAIGGVVIRIVGSLNLGLWVRGFATAFVAGIVIAVIGITLRFVIMAIGLPNPGGLIGLVAYLIVSAVVLMFADKLLAGLTVHGFKGALIASVAISVILWVFGVFLSAMGIGATV